MEMNDSGQARRILDSGGEGLGYGCSVLLWTDVEKLGAWFGSFSLGSCQQGQSGRA